MESDIQPPARISFRQDKMGLNAKMAKNQFGHTVLGTHGGDVLPESEVEISLDATGKLNAHVDIFRTPAMQKFMLDNNLSLTDLESESTQEEVIDLVSEPPMRISDAARPTTLEEFDTLADSILGIPATRVSETPIVSRRFFEPPSGNAIASRPMQAPSRLEEQKPARTAPSAPPQPGGACAHCNSHLPLEARYCPACGTANHQIHFCIHCGHKHHGQEKFCSECGHKR